jgi:hypothetical protein
MRIASILCVLFSVASCQASIFVGSSVGNQNDNLANVTAVINAYNSANDPDFLTTFSLLGKTDEGDIAFDGSDGFQFWEDQDMTTPILSAGALHSLGTAYFQYDDSQGELLYYSVKGGNQGFNLYAFMPGTKNFLTTPTGQDISHVSFWEGMRPDFIPVIPEPSSLLVWTCLLTSVGLVLTRR